MPARHTAVVLLVALVFVASVPADAAPGDLDPTFGGDGKVETNVGGYFSVPASVVVQPDGAIVAAGVLGPTGSDVVLVRWEPDGDLDPTFDGDGIVTTDFGADEVARAVAVQWDGKIVMAGATGFTFGIDADVILARYLTDGTLDPTFGVGGKVVTNLGVREGAGDMIILGDERIVVAAFSFDDVGPLPPGLTVIRYLADGTLDPTFGSGGSTTTPVGGANTRGSRLVLQPDGKIVAGTFEDLDDNIVLARYDTAGALDPTFGNDGISTAELVNGENLTDVVRLANGRLVAAAQYFDTGANRQNGVLIGFESDGDVDDTFGTAGFLYGSLAPGENDSFNAMVRQPDDKLLAAGGQNGGLAIRRYAPDGTPDPTFGVGGTAGTHGFSDATSVTQQSDGKIVVTGRVCYPPPPGFPPPCQFAAARLENDSPPVTPAPTATPMPTPTLACPAAPAAGCATPAPKAAQLKIMQPSDPIGNRLDWKWKKGSATAFGDPTTTTAYSLCVYDAGTLVTTVFAEPAGTCNATKPAPCWRGIGKPAGSKGYQYRDRDRAFDGLDNIKLKPSATTGKASISVSARGAALSLTVLPASPPVTVQLHDGAGACFTATYSANLTTTTSELFKAKSD